MAENNNNQPIDSVKLPKGDNGAGKKRGKYNVLVKVIDIFGNDTTKLIEIKV